MKFFLVAVFFITGTHVYSKGQNDRPRWVSQRLLVHTNPGHILIAIENVDRQIGALSLVEEVAPETFMLRYSTSLSEVAAAKKLAQSPGVSWAQPDYLFYPPVEKTEVREASSVFLDLKFEIVNLGKSILSDPPVADPPEMPENPVKDPEISKAWGLKKISAEKSWAISKGNKEIVVADIDTGVDYNHPDLTNNIWRNPNPSNENDLVGFDFANNDSLPFDDMGHGTHTAGTLGAVGGNGVGISGVSQKVSIMILKFLAASGSGTTSDAVKSIDYAVKNGARVLSNSWGGKVDKKEEPENRALIEAIQRAHKANVLFVAAAGNDGANNDEIPVYPAAIDLPNILTVASSNDSDRRSFFSNFGPKTVHVAAPGSNIYSTIPGGKYTQFSGTSMACPHVAGLAALILSVNPDLTAEQVKSIIMDTVDPLPAFEGKIVTGGRVNAAAALMRAQQFEL